MRILFILHQFFPEFTGGTERVTLNLARMAQRAGHHVHVLAGTADVERSGGEAMPGLPPGARRGSYQGVPVTYLSRKALPAAAEIALDPDEALVAPLAAWMKAERFDVAQVLHTMRMGTAVLAAQRCGLPYVLTLTDFFLPCARINLVTAAGAPCSGPEEGRKCARDCNEPPWTEPGLLQRYQQAQSMLAAAADRVAPSASVARIYTEAFAGQAVRVIPHGVDLLAMAQAASAPREASNVLRLAWVGAVVPQKGLDILLKALALLPGRALRLQAIGGFYGNAGYHEDIRALAAADPRVELVGALPPAGVYARLAASDLLCLSSQVPESYSLVLHESAAVGVPALVGDLGAQAEHVAASGCGRIVDAADPRAWADAIDAVLREPALLRRWRDALALPLRIEEEAFFYESLWRRARRPAVS
ncbi:glycosyltransferase [Ramlibacter sp.]|uniref:glycosyltransferase n=1 Tax=Ramlibacter sp. TaxID=1917967 RepID=UPI0017B9C7EC|nr:glycosyltransferase [Ramlibacter sp.]MBA2673424.1 glycosyltransferase [Ramlibacter sp.]